MSDWKFGLCSCLADCGKCLYGYFCPCLLFGQSAERMNEGVIVGPGSFGNCVVFLVSMFLGLPECATCIQRGKVRRKYGIDGSDCGDWCASCFCLLCALVQSSNEIEYREAQIQAQAQQQPTTIVQPVIIQQPVVVQQPMMVQQDPMLMQQDPMLMQQGQIPMQQMY